jgi:integrase
MVKLPWIPAEAEWLQLLEMFRPEPIRNRLMLALAYDSALRREELCSLRTDDSDPAHRMLRIRAETTKTRQAGLRAQLVAVKDARARLLSSDLEQRRRLERDLHDGAQQRLLAVALRLGALETQVRDDPDAAASVSVVRKELHVALDELRDLARGSIPPSSARPAWPARWRRWPSGCPSTYT